MGATGFILLLVTGLILEWPPLSPLAVGGWSRLLHRIGAVMYILWPILYASLRPKDLMAVVKESLTYGRDEWEWFKRMPGYFLGRASKMPPQGRVNAGQKLHHLGVGVTSILVVSTGLVLWLGKGQLGASGLAVTAMIHDISMLVLTVLLVGHVYFTFLYGALPAMLTGYVPESYARLEHSKWLATLQTAPSVPDSVADSKTDRAVAVAGQAAPAQTSASSERQAQPNEAKKPD
jgi:formate dehydrogenase subunit gamma